jgi:hypothetical protein
MSTAVMADEPDHRYSLQLSKIRKQPICSGLSWASSSAQMPICGFCFAMMCAIMALIASEYAHSGRQNGSATTLSNIRASCFQIIPRPCTCIVTLGATQSRDIVAQRSGQPDAVSRIRTLDSPVDIAWAAAWKGQSRTQSLRH